MVNGSSCQVCAWTLRWAPEQMAWVCDRCRAVVPAQPAAQPAYAGAPPSTQQGQPASQQGPSAYAQQGQPAYPPQGQPAYPPQSQPAYPPQGQPAYPPHGQPGYPPQGQPAYPPHGQSTFTPPAPYPPQASPAHAAVAPRNKSSKALWIAIGGAIVVAGIIVVVVLATRGSGSTDGASDEPSVANADKADKATDKADKATDKADKATDKADTDKPAGTDGYAVMLAKMSAFKDRACACKDKACIDVLQADMVRWSTDQAKNPPKMNRVDEAATKQMSTVMDAYTKCLTDVLVASAGVATPPSHVGSAAATPSTAALAVGDRVMARWTNGRWYPGKIGAVRADGTYDIKYDDGDRSNALSASNVRKQSSSTNSTSKSSSSSSSNAPCPGPGLTRRCNGVCVNIQENNNHCGGCNNRCPSGKSCDGHMFCRDAQGNL